MNFFQFNWADSDLESINVEFNRASLTIWNDDLQKRLAVDCIGLAGITNVCIWDDTIIMNADLNSVDATDSDFVRRLYEAYDKNYDYGGRSLKEGLYELKIELANNIAFSVYCQEVDVKYL